MEPILGDPILREIRRLANSDGPGETTDAELLARFAGKNDQSAFEALLDRHGPMVLRLCRRHLTDSNAADDAFQATFLVLVRKAGAIRKPELLSSWLYGVALRVVRHAQADAANRRKHEARLGTRVVGDPTTETGWAELCGVLDEELNRLPDKYRAAFLLCYVEGKTRDQVARQLGWALRTLDRQLEKGRTILQVRLTRRGITLAAVLLAIGSASRAASAMTPVLKKTVAATCMALMKGADLTALSGPGVVLAQDVLKGMTMLKFKMNVAIWSCVLTLGCMAAAFGYFANDREGTPPIPQAVVQANAEQTKVNDPPKDMSGDSLPTDALVRLGTLRFRYDSVVRALAFAKDGKSLLCAGWDKAIRRWNTQTGAELHTLHGPDKGFVDAAISADGKTLIGGTVDGNVHVWDLIAGKEIKKITVPDGKVIRKVAIAPDGRTAAVTGDDNAVHLLDLTTGVQLRVLVTYKQQPSCVAFSSDGKLVGSASYDGAAHVHDASTGKEVSQPLAKKGNVYSMCFAPDGKTLVAGEEGALTLWDAATGKQQRRVEGLGAQLFAIAFTSDGKSFAGGTSGGQVYFWDTASAKQIQTIKAHADNIQALAFSPDGNTLASGGSERGVRVWDTATGKQLNVMTGHQERVSAVAVAPGGKIVATAGWDHSVRLWDADTGRELRKFGWTPKDNLPLGTSPSVNALIFSPDGKLLAAAGYENQVWLWNLETGEPAWNAYGICADFSPDGKYLAAAGWTPIAKLYDAATGKEVRQFVGHVSGVADLKFTPDGKTLITASVGAPFGMRVPGEKWDKQTIWLWDVATGKARHQFGGERRQSGLAISPDGRSLSAAGLIEKDLHVWEIASGKERATLHGHGDMIFTSAFSPDGRLLATGSMDNTIRLWHMPSGKHAHAFAGHRGWALSVAFAPDGKKLASSSLDTTGIVWKMPTMAEPQAVKLVPAELEKLWTDLASADAKIAYQAIAALAAAPTQSVPFFSEKLKPVTAPDAKLVAQWIIDLDNTNFATRQNATTALEKLAELAVPQLRSALDKQPALEAARRIEKILEAVAEQALPAETLRGVRAVETLEHIATPNARAVLVPLSHGASGARLTRDAQATLARLEKRRI